MAGLTDIARTVSDREGLAPSFGQKVVSAVFDELRERLENGETVVIPGLGRFHWKKVGRKRLRPPRSKKPVTVYAHQCPAFVPADSLRARIREKTEVLDG